MEFKLKLLTFAQAMSFTKDIAGEEGFYKSGNHETFANKLIILVEIGWSIEKSLDFLEDLYDTVSGEYGN